MRHFLGRFLLAFSLVFLSTPLSASRVSPMILELEPTGRGSIARVDLVNDSQRDIPYEAQIMRGVISPEGQLALYPADEEFVVFPAQTMVESNSRQVFRVQYVGESALNKSEVFYLAIRQIPVQFEPGVTQVQLVVNYNVLINVVPNGSLPEPSIRSATMTTRLLPAPADAQDASGEDRSIERRGIEVDVGNIGNRYFLAGLSDWSITGATVDGAPFERVLRGDDASKLIGVGVVAPGANRLFFIPTEVELDPSSLQVSINP
ncbi:MAG: fimbria/pilus periplasmic chaperone [Parvularcula sp.]|jgi:fimbrial chaperone protein|nr:fimbria/pilus periplasmic chaperone [Parvularcula sp.]